ncbi:hypothetical protein [Herbiconiux sp. L3-i23]|uniref:hypothetical protein n=1 Tax=Herbiconiux sp. L3-i23 TaxID=2905871 RepID=UPI002073E21E|nr:hypothetical protein [Herbiconiux sp. L3-i23]
MSDRDDAVQIADEELRSWLRTKAGGRRRSVESIDWDGPGEYRLGPRADLRVVRIEHETDPGVRQLARFTERNEAGEWLVNLYAFSTPTSRRGASQTIVVEAGLVGADEDEVHRKLAPPRVVEQILTRANAFDGDIVLRGRPEVVRQDDVQEVIDAIFDDGRSVSLIVASSPGYEVDQAWTEIAGSLTKHSVGVATTFVVTDGAVESLNAQLPSHLQVRRGRVRTFMPGVDAANEADGVRHRILGPATLARAIRGRRVDSALQTIHATGPRRRLLEQVLPADVRRGMELLAKEETARERLVRVNERILQSVEPSAADIRTEADSTRSPDSQAEADHEAAQSGSNATGSENRPGAAPLPQRLARFLARWLGRPARSEAELDEVDHLLTRHKTEAEVALEQIDELLVTQNNLEQELKTLRTELDEMEIDTALQELEAQEARRQAEAYRARLKAAKRFDDLFVAPEQERWNPPESIQELLARLTEGEEAHPVLERVVFTGDASIALEVQKRDQMGRYAATFWDYVRVLHDYARAKATDSYAGGVHQYLTDPNAPEGRRCPPQRHAATESESVINQWLHERIFPVPLEVDGSGKKAMLAHFKPTHENTFAPRMHYFDDTSRSGKVYIGYIGKHLTNTKT